IVTFATLKSTPTKMDLWLSVACGPDSPISSDKQEGLLSPTCHPSNVHHIRGFPKEYYVA
uniref:Uncharacterized protein n=1 Tax=Myotis lucifugus TaxID=59463 RepID=G1Q9S3_MYOLU